MFLLDGKMGFVSGAASVLAVLGIGMMLGSGMRSAPPTIVDATQFRIVDEKGVVRGIWGTDGANARFQLLDNAGAVRLNLQGGDAASMALVSEKGAKAFSVSYRAEYGTFLKMTDQLGDDRIMFEAEKNACDLSLLRAGKKPGFGVAAHASGLITVRGYSRDGTKFLDYVCENGVDQKPK